MADVIHPGVDYHCLFVRAMSPYRGQTLTTGQITNICIASGFRPKGVILPNDHADGNANPWCEMQCDNSDYQIFDRLGRGRYRVRPILYWCDGSVA